MSVEGPRAWHFDRPDGLEQVTFRFPEARDNKKCNLQNGQVGMDFSASARDRFRARVNLRTNVRVRVGISKQASGTAEHGSV